MPLVLGGCASTSTGDMLRQLSPPCCISKRLMCVTPRAGLHEGLRSLIAGGAPPGFLIIDDGWQCTDVDQPLREPPMVRVDLGLGCLVLGARWLS